MLACTDMTKIKQISRQPGPLGIRPNVRIGDDNTPPHAHRAHIRRGQICASRPAVPQRVLQRASSPLLAPLPSMLVRHARAGDSRGADSLSPARYP